MESMRNTSFSNLVNYENTSSSNNNGFYYEPTAKNDCLSSLMRDNQLVYYSVSGQKDETPKPTPDNQENPL